MLNISLNLCQLSSQSKKNDELLITIQGQNRLLCFYYLKCETGTQSMHCYTSILSSIIIF